MIKMQTKLNQMLNKNTRFLRYFIWLNRKQPVFFKVYLFDVSTACATESTIDI